MLRNKIITMLITVYAIISNVSTGAESLNYALSKRGARVTASAGNTFAYCAIDGNPKTYWGAEPYPQWLKIRLVEAYNINDIKILFFEGRAYRYKLEVSMDNKNWQLITDKTKGSWKGWQNISFPAIKTRYIKLTVTHNSANKGIHVRSLEVYGPAEQSKKDKGKIAIKKMRASSEVSHIKGHMAEFAADGKTGGSSYWCTDFKSRPPHWLEADFGKKISFNRINLYMVPQKDNSGLLEDFKIEYWNGKQWTKLIAVKDYYKNSTLKWTSTPEEICKKNISVWGYNFPSIKAEKIRLYISKTPSQLARLYELEVMNTRLSTNNDKKQEKNNKDLNKFKFDFGTGKSPVKTGYLSVSPETVYSKSRGYGWTNTTGLMGGDRIAANDLDRDFVAGTGQGNFKIDLPNGVYRIYLRLGDIDYASPVFDVYANGVLKSKNIGTTKRADVKGEQFEVTVNNNCLELSLQGSNAWLLNGLLVYPVNSLKKMAKEVENITIDLGCPIEQAKFFKLTPQNISSKINFTKKEKNTGYVVFTPNYLKKVYPSTLPMRSEIKPDINLESTPGLYTPAVIAVHALTTLRTVKITTNDLVTAKGNRIAKENINIRKVECWPQMAGMSGSSNTYKYQVTPELLREYQALSIAQGTSKQYWVTIKIPQNAKSGYYKSKIFISPKNKKQVAIDLVLRVLSFKLKTPNDFFAAVAYSVFKKSNAEIKQDFIDMRNHAMNGIVLCHIDIPLKRINGQTADISRLASIIEIYKEVGWTKPIILAEAKLDAIKVIKKISKEKNWPEIIFYPLDEPFSKTKMIAAKKVLTAIKKETGVKTQITLTAESARFLSSLLDIRTYTLSLIPGGFEPDKLKAECKKAGALFYWYTNGCREYFESARFKAGYFFWKTGAKGQWYFAYQYPICNTWNDLDTMCEGKDWCMAYPTPNGPISTIEWECLREGIYDFKYLYTLEQAIKMASKTKAAECAKAKQLLAKIRKETLVDLNEYKKRFGSDLALHIRSAWAPEKYDRYRKEIAKQIIRLNK